MLGRRADGSPIHRAPAPSIRSFAALTRTSRQRHDVSADDANHGRNSGRETGRPGHGIEMIMMTIAKPEEDHRQPMLARGIRDFRILTRAT